MSQLAYRYELDGEGAHENPIGVPVDVLAPVVSVFGDAAVLEPLLGDARRAGLSVRGTRPLESLLDADGVVLGDIVLVECGDLDGARIAALVRLDLRAARAGARIVVCTSAESLEDVFGCLESCGARILVDPTAAQRALALGEALMRLPHSRVRELDEADRLVLLRLTEEVGRLANKVDRLASAPVSDRLASPGRDFRGEGHERYSPRIPLPDPRVIYRAIRQRRLRDRFFDAELFADPAWDILLDLTAARAEHRRVSVTSLCIAAAVPASTALRWIAQMTEMGILVRKQDEEDRRRAFVALSDKAADAMARYFGELGEDAAKLV